MKLEVLLSVMNLNKKNLDQMNITSKCTVINQCDKKDYEKYKNFDIYSYKEIGLSNSRNRGLEKVSEDIILISDDDIIYDKNYEENIINEFKNNPKADLIVFNVESPLRSAKKIKKRKKLHIYNSLRFASCNIAFKKESIKDIRFNTLFGPNAKFSNGSDTMFLLEVFKNKLNVYCCPINIGTVYHEKSTWFSGYDEKYFYNKGALFTAVNPKIRHFLMMQYLLRHKEVLTNYKLIKAYKIMLNGSKDYLEYKNKNIKLK